jgi:hypothetical protein
MSRTNEVGHPMHVTYEDTMNGHATLHVTCSNLEEVGLLKEWVAGDRSEGFRGTWFSLSKNFPAWAVVNKGLT